jgi:hypothetical protein
MRPWISPLGIHHRFSWVGLTKYRCSEIVLGEASMRYGNLLARLTVQRKRREMSIIRASCGWRDPAAMAEVALWGGKRGGGRVRVSVCLSRAGTWLTAWPGHKCAQCTSRSARRARCRTAHPRTKPSTCWIPSSPGCSPCTDGEGDRGPHRRIPIEAEPKTLIPHRRGRTGVFQSPLLTTSGVVPAGPLKWPLPRPPLTVYG